MVNNQDPPQNQPKSSSEHEPDKTSPNNKRVQLPKIKLPKMPSAESINSVTKLIALRMAQYGAALILFGLLLKLTVEGFQNNTSLKWINLITLLLGFGLSTFVVWKNKDHWLPASLHAVLLLFLIIAASLFYSTSDVHAFSLFGRATESFLNPVFIIVYAGLLGWLWFRFKAALFIKIILTLPLLYLSSTFIYGALIGIGLEDSFLGVDFFGYIPYFLQPIYLTIHILFPILTVIVGMQYFKNKSSSPLVAKALLWVFCVILVTDLLGFVAMNRNRVPNIFSLIFSPKLGIGQAEITFITEKGTQTTARLTTTDYEQQKNEENAKFYTMALSYTKSEGERRHFNLSVKDNKGNDVLFLGQNDFTFYQDGKIQEPYDVNFELGGVKSGQNVILILDHSGSMSGKMNELKLAAKTFVDLKARKDMIQLIPFGDTIEVQQISDDKEFLKSRIDAYDYLGGTDLYAACIKALELAEQMKGTTTIVTMTDGEATDKSKQNEETLNALLQKKIARIYTVGLGDPQSLDEKFLQDLAQAGQGRYQRTEDATKLKDIYQAIGAELQSKYTAWYEYTPPPPQLTITSPQDQAILYDNQSLTAKITNFNDVQIDKVLFYANDNLIQQVAGHQQQDYEAQLTIKDLGVGKHQLKVIAQSTKGEQVEQSIGIEIQKAIELKLLRPSEGDTVSNMVDIEAQLIRRGNLQISSVSFYINGKEIKNLQAPPYTAQWNTENDAGGEYELKVAAHFYEGDDLTDSIKVKLGKALIAKLISPGAESPLAQQESLQIAFENLDTADPVKKVEYWLGDQTIATSTESPFTNPWDTSVLEAGRHYVKAIAHTQSGQTASDGHYVHVFEGQINVNLEGAKTSAEGEGAGGEATFIFPPQNVEILLDISNSMWARLADGSKIDIAKSVLSDLIKKIPSETKVALRVYGSESPVSSNNCKDSTLVYPLANLNQTEVLSKIQGLNPKGKTPIAYSLKQTQEDLKAAQGDSVLILITDGVESCDGDPIGVIKELAASGFKVKLHVIGFDVDQGAQELSKLAQAGGGEYFSAVSALDLESALAEAVKVNYQVIDHADKVVLHQAVSAQTFSLRTGPYKIKIDLDPPLVKENVMIQANQLTKIQIVKGAGGFELR